MPKDVKKKLSTKKSADGLKAKAAAASKKAEKPAAAPAAPVKATPEEGEKEKEKKSVKVVEPKEDKKGKAPATSSTSPAKAAPSPKPAKATKAAPASAPLEKRPLVNKKKEAAKKTPVSRKKQAPPRKMGPNSDEEESEDEASEEEQAAPAPAPTPKAAPAKAKAGKKAAPVVEESEDEKDQANAAESDDEEAGHLHGFSTDDEDSSDDEDENVMNEDFDPKKLPTVPKDDKAVKERLDRAKKQKSEDRGVLYLGRVPHGFYEEEMKSYFSQFGDVTRLRVARNKKTGASKHYAFVEFSSASVAQIVAETMDNYLLHGHLLQCKVIPKDEVHPQLWVGSNRKWRVVPSAQLAKSKHNKKRDEATREQVDRRLVKRQNQRKRKLEDLGISYDFETIGYKKAKAVAA